MLRAVSASPLGEQSCTFVSRSALGVYMVQMANGLGGWSIQGPGVWMNQNTHSISARGTVALTPGAAYQVTIQGGGFLGIISWTNPANPPTLIGDPEGLVQIGTTSSDNPNADVAVGNGGQTFGGLVAANTTGQSTGAVAVSGTGCASGVYSSQCGDFPSGLVAISGTGNAASGTLAASGTGDVTRSKIGVAGDGHSCADTVSVSVTGDANPEGCSYGKGRPGEVSVAHTLPASVLSNVVLVAAVSAPQPTQYVCTFRLEAKAFYDKPARSYTITEFGSSKGTTTCPAAVVPTVFVSVYIKHTCYGADHQTSNSNTGDGDDVVYTETLQRVGLYQINSWCSYGTGIEWIHNLKAFSAWGDEIRICIQLNARYGGEISARSCSG